MRSKKTKTLVTGLALALGISGLFVSPANAAATDKGTLVVWMMPDAKGWQNAIDGANATFHAKYPNVKVDIQYQTWGDHLTKFESTLVSKKTPDVIEFGNTEVTKYAAAGALLPLNKSDFQNSATWLKGLADAGSFNGKTYAVPYYAGSRAVIYRTDIYNSLNLSAPKSLNDFIANGKAIMASSYATADPTFSALYLPGKYWYAAGSFVYDAGGSFAKLVKGKWVGNLESAQSISGLNNFKTVSDSLSRADKNGTEASQWTAMAAGKGAMSYGNGWELGISAPTSTAFPKGDISKVSAFPMPSSTPGKYAPAFLGGSNLAVPAASKHTAWGTAWISAYTNTSQETLMVGAGVLPNTTSLLNLVNGASAPFAEAAKSTWFVPQSPNWVNVELAQVPQQLFSSIADGSKTVQQAAVDADKLLNIILNAN
jgi:N,N'-diacetylchitobiose transport system substrate-binding protein